MGKKEKYVILATHSMMSDITHSEAKILCAGYVLGL